MADDRDALQDDLTRVLFDASQGAGFPFTDLDVAADVTLSWLHGRGLLATAQVPVTVMVLMEQRPGRGGVLASLHLSLTDAQIEARRIVARTARAAVAGDPWRFVDDAGRPTWTWSPVVDGRPAGTFIVVQVPVR